jgi:hypothetical protein
MVHQNLDLGFLGKRHVLALLPQRARTAFGPNRHRRTHAAEAAGLGGCEVTR